MKYRVIIIGLAVMFFLSILYINILSIKKKQAKKEWHKLPDIVHTLKPGDTVIVTNPTDTLYIEVYNKSDNIE